MTFFKTPDEAKNGAHYPSSENCVECGQPLKGPTVSYDLIGDGPRTDLFHRNCAFEVAQRLICDAWPNRHEDKKMA